ncbi:MAG: hypothetical protein QNJ05_11650 [Woeseiaceae bacterium]|nr:hypothetical protein [Woeseiaceae bacterium]
MNRILNRSPLPLMLALLPFVLAACATPTPVCDSPQTRSLDTAVTSVKAALTEGCHARYDSYYDDLLKIAEGDPKPENKRVFSEFLVWSADAGILSQRQAEEYYNRFFNVKFMSLRSDYNTCSHTCPSKRKVLLDMERELSDKERGLLKVSLDSNGYYRADRLYQEVELVLEATCTACNAGR